MDQSDNSQIAPEDIVIPEEIRPFLESCLVEKGLDDLPEETKEQMMGDLAERLNRWLFMTTFARLSQDEQSEFTKLADDERSNQQTVEQFFRSRIPEIDELYARSMIEFKRTYVGH